MEQWLRDASRQAESAAARGRNGGLLRRAHPARTGRRCGVGGVRVAIGPQARDRRTRRTQAAAPLAAELTCRSEGTSTGRRWTSGGRSWSSRPILGTSARTTSSSFRARRRCARRRLTCSWRAAKAVSLENSVLKCEQITTLKKHDVDPVPLGPALRARTDRGGRTGCSSGHRNSDLLTVDRGFHVGGHDVMTAA